LISDRLHAIIKVRRDQFILETQENSKMNFAWYLDLTPNQMFSLDDYPIPGKRGLPLCEKYGRQLEMNETAIYDKELTQTNPPDHCWICKSQIC